MADGMTQAEFLSLFHTARAEWDALMGRIDEARMTEPGVEGDWSVKDIVAHVTWYEREMVDLLRARALAGSDIWNLPLDERNAAIFEQNRKRTLADVLAESRAVFQQFRSRPTVHTFTASDFLLTGVNLPVKI